MAYVEPHTHPIRPTLTREEAGDDVLDLWCRLRDIIRNEEAWYIIQEWKDEQEQKVPEITIESGFESYCHFGG
jgi:hypothetical protein